MIHESECGMRNERRRFNLSNEVDVFYDPVIFIFFFFYGRRKRGSSATNYRGEEFDSFRLISPQTTRILAI